MNRTKPLHVFIFNEDDNGGEALVISTFKDEYGQLYQDLILQSYCNSATFNLCGSALLPETLRKLADELIK